MRKRRTGQDKTAQAQQVVDALRTATPEALEAALRALRNGSGGKKKRKKSRFHGSDHFLSREEFDALCAASTPTYATLWRLMVGHALRVSEALALKPEDVANGYITVRRLKGSQRGFAQKGTPDA